MHAINEKNFNFYSIIDFRLMVNLTQPTVLCFHNTIPQVNKPMVDSVVTYVTKLACFLSFNPSYQNFSHIWLMKNMF